MSACDVSIIIVSYNTRELTADCLKSVYEQTHAVTFEIIIVDNASSDGSQHMLTEQFPQVKLLANKDNRGFAAANNQAIKIAAGRYVLLLNSDTIVLDGAIDKCVRHCDEEPKIGALAPKLFWPNRTRQPNARRVLNLKHLTMETAGLCRLFPQSNMFNSGEYGGIDWDQEHDVEWLGGAFLMVRSAAIAQVGMLDEDFFMYGEDVEWCFRIHRGGWRVVYYPGAQIVHIGGASSDGAGPSIRAQVAKRRGQLLVVDKTSGPIAAWLSNVIMLLGVIPRWPMWICMDIRAAMRGKIKSWRQIGRLQLIQAHLEGLIRPTWRPANKC